MTMLVFGKSGQVATALRKSGATSGVGLVAIGRDQIDFETLTAPAPIIDLIKHHKATAILNAAAYTQVDKAESEPEIAHAVNATAPGILAAACKSCNIPLIHVSTDFVFDGSAVAPYKESAATGPLGVYGHTKLAGEQAILRSKCACAILRTAWVFSATGTNFVKTMLRLGTERSALTIIADQQGTPTPASAIADAMIEVANALIKAPEKSGIYHFAGDEQTSWAGFARAIFTEAGLATTVTDITTDQYPTPATRPAWSVLDCTLIHNNFGISQPSWRKALRETIAALKQI